MSGTTSPGSPTSPPPAPRNRTATIIAISGALVAVLSVPTAIIGLVSASRSSDRAEVAQAQVSVASSAATSDARVIDQAQRTIEQQAAAIDSIEAERDAAQSSVAVLTSSVAVLTSQLATATAAMPEPAPPSSEAAPSTSVVVDTAAADFDVYHKGVFSIADDGDSFYFSAPPSDAKWSAHSPLQYYNSELYLTGGILIIRGAAQVKLTAGTLPTYETCSAQTTYTRQEGISASNLSEVADRCIRVDDLYGTIRLVSQEGSTLTVELTTWLAG